MQSAVSFVKKNLAYVFIVFGVVWVAVAYLAGSALVLWPAVACVAAGVLLRLKPNSRLSTAWPPSAAALGLLLCAYQAYVAATLLLGAFAVIASASLVVFVLLGLGHLYLVVASYSATSVK